MLPINGYKLNLLKFITLDLEDNPRFLVTLRKIALLHELDLIKDNRNMPILPYYLVVGSLPNVK